MRLMHTDIRAEFTPCERWLALALIVVCVVAGGLLIAFRQIGRADGPLVTPPPEHPVPPPKAIAVELQPGGEG